mgnify:FL=1
MSGPQSVVLVYSVAHAVRIERLLKACSVGCRMIPVPRHLSSDCGVCVLVQDSDEPAVRQAIEDAHIEIQGIEPLPAR